MVKFMNKWAANLTILGLALAVFIMSPNAHAECYQSAAGGINHSINPPCVGVDAFINASGLSVPASATNPMPVTFPTGDACQNPTVKKASAVLNISTATTTALVSAVAGKVVYLCSFNFSTGGTAPTYTFKTGTQITTACDTSAASLTGAITPTSGTLLASVFTGTQMQSISGGQLCLTTGGTTPTALGFITYVQQ